MKSEKKQCQKNINKNLSSIATLKLIKVIFRKKLCQTHEILNLLPTGQVTGLDFRVHTFTRNAYREGLSVLKHNSY